jgi:hypothetical protein
MTVIDGIEIDCLYYKMNDIKFAIKNNEPIEEKLNVIITISNPCLYKRRYILLNEFICIDISYQLILFQPTIANRGNGKYIALY